MRCKLINSGPQGTEITVLVGKKTLGCSTNGSSFLLESVGPDCFKIYFLHDGMKIQVCANDSTEDEIPNLILTKKAQNLEQVFNFRKAEDHVFITCVIKNLEYYFTLGVDGTSLIMEQVMEPIERHKWQLVPC